jgi:hypothetical protein
MERRATLDEAKVMYGENFIGIEAINKISPFLNFKIPIILPEFNFSIKELEDYSEDYILILALSEFNNGKPVNLIEFRNLLGVSQDTPPCFYNQDWYLKEKFATLQLSGDWHFVRKTILDSTRALSPEIISLNRKLPTAILCAYTFFVYYFINKVILWENDYLWCSDRDENGDRVYVGRYKDILGINKDGFSIHRHLSIRNCYGSI